MNGANRRVVDEVRERLILDQLESQRPLTQRTLSSDLGIALGLTNLLIRRLVKKGWVRVSRVSPRRIRYLITPAGVAAKARLTREYFLSSLMFYRDSRERMRERLAVIATAAAQGAEARPRVAFYGVGDVAEVAYVCLQETNLELVGVVDPRHTGAFFRMAVHPPSALAGTSLAGEPFSRLIVMPLQDEPDVRANLEARNVPLDAVSWL